MKTESSPCGEESRDARWSSLRPGRHGSLRIRRDSESVVIGIAGEADFTNHDQLLEALHEVVQGVGDVYLDVSGLTFVDVAATRALLAAAADLGPCRRMVMIEPCHSLLIILSSAGFRLPEQLILLGNQGPVRPRRPVPGGFQSTSETTDT